MWKKRVLMAWWQVSRSLGTSATVRPRVGMASSTSTWMVPVGAGWGHQLPGGSHGGPLAPRLGRLPASRGPGLGRALPNTPVSSQHPGLRLLALNCESLMWAHTCSQAHSQRAWTSVRPLVRTGQAPGRSLPQDAPGKPPPVIHRGAGGLGVPGVGQAASPLDPTSHLGTRHPRVGVWREGWREVLSSGVGGVGGVPGWLLPESRGWMHWFGAHPGHGKHAPQGPPSCGHGWASAHPQEPRPRGSRRGLIPSAPSR